MKKKKSSNPMRLNKPIPVSVIVVTKNEERKITRCLEALIDFAEIIVVDSGSSDKTKFLAEAHGARVVNFRWNGRYPKKRQWCLEQFELAQPWVFFVDADEIVTPQLVQEIRTLFEDGPKAAGYFVQGRYVWQGQALRFGQRNNKLCLLDRRKIEFPVIDDLPLFGMGEIEGHYQPVLKAPYRRENLGQLHHALLHYAQDNEQSWLSRHQRYADWERGMNARNAWPKDPVLPRQWAKRIFRALPFRPVAAFFYSAVYKLGILDGRAGVNFALSRARYYHMISRANKDAGRIAGLSTAPIGR